MMPRVILTTQIKLLPASFLAVAIVLSSPWIGEARSWLRRALPNEFSFVINASLGVVALAAVAVSVWRIREDRARRYATLIGAAALATLTAVWSAAPSASQNAVERVHFVEYGLMTALFYRAWRERGDLSVVLLPLVAGLIVGTADEWWQWFVPERIGEWRDIFINFGAIGSGLLVSLALAPPAAFDIGLRPDSRRAVCLAAAASVLALALFIQTVHLGHVVTDHEIGVFRSRYTADELLALAADRGVRWRVDPPPMTIHRLSREDQYLAEALWHVRARNDAWGVGDIGRAWRENLTLERYFAPALDLRSYLTPDGVRWPDPQRADAEARARPARDEEFTSLAAPANFVLVWPRADFWAGTLALFALLAAAGSWPPRPGRGTPPGT
jgi:VanZ family protein